MTSNEELRYKVGEALTCDKGCGHKIDPEVCFQHQVDRVKAIIDQALTAYKKNLLSKAVPVAALRTKDKEFEQIQAIPVSAIDVKQ